MALLLALGLPGHVTAELDPADLAPAQRTASTAPTALVCWLRGEIFVRPPEGGAEDRLELFAHLPSGAHVRTTATAELIVVFRHGSRFAIGPATRARIGPDRVQALQGTVRRLSSVPTMTSLPRLSPAVRPGRRPGASRIRGTDLGSTKLGMSPASGATVLTDTPVLRFTPLPGIERYVVEVSQLSGAPVFTADVDASAPHVTLPPHLVRAGASYHWRVRSRTYGRLTTHGDALFTTLDRQSMEQRRRLARHAEQAADPSSLLLLAAFDRQTGLRHESCTGLVRVLAREPDNSSLERWRQAWACPDQR